MQANSIEFVYSKENGAEDRAHDDGWGHNYRCEKMKAKEIIIRIEYQRASSIVGIWMI